MKSAWVSKQARWKVSITTTVEAEDAVAEMLGRKFGESASSYTDLETGTTTVAVFLAQKPPWSRAMRSALRADLDQLARYRLKRGVGRISLSKVRWENWAESWKRHFPSFTIGSTLVVKPTWSRRKEATGQVSVILDPGLSFGTGHHATTRFCLEQIVVHRTAGKRQSFLDIGTGSGILTLAAAKLGYEPVDAFDIDRDAIRIARANARLNRVFHRVHFWQKDLTKVPLHSTRKYSLVCANLISNLLMAEKQRIIARVAEDGFLVLAGILKTEFSRIQRVFCSRGLRLLVKRAKGQWCSGTFCWRF